MKGRVIDHRGVSTCVFESRRPLSSLEHLFTDDDFGNIWYNDLNRTNVYQRTNAALGVS